METIDGAWIKDRLTGRRGEKAALARALGVGPDIVTKLLSDERNVQPAEFIPLLRFFKISLGGPEVPEEFRPIVDAYDRLSEQDQAYLRRTAEILAVIAAQARDQSPSGSEAPPVEDREGPQ